MVAWAGHAVIVVKFEILVKDTKIPGVFCDNFWYREKNIYLCTLEKR